MITPAYAVTATERVLPRMALDFTTGVLDPRVTVTRALNTATRVNSSGLIETVNADLPRFDYDPATLAPKGILIEESRANLVIQSEDFNTTWSASNVAVSTNTTASPSGQMNADTLTPSSVSGVLSQSITFTGNGDKTISIFVLAGTSGTTQYFLRDTTAATPRGIATITWTGGVPSVVGSNGGTVQGVDDYGNGWYRIRLLCAGVVAANANSLRIQPDSVTGTGTVTVWGAQAENGAFATSYIPTTTTSLTRNADVVSMTGTNFSSWYNAGAGAFVSRYSSVAATASTTKAIISANDGTGNNRIYNYITTTAAPAQLVITGGVTQANPLNSAISNNTVAKTAMGYGTDSFSISTNGAAPVLDTSGSVPSVNTLNIGHHTGILQLNGWFQTLYYYPQKLTNSENQAFSK